MSPRTVADALRARLRGLSSRDRRALMLGAAVLVPAIVWMGLVRPYLATVGELSDRAASERALLDRELELIREAPAFPERIRTARAALDRWDARFVRSSNVALAEAEVTSLLEEVARERRVLLQEVRALGRASAEDTPAGLRPIRLSVRGESDFEGVLGFVHGMEQDPLLLRIVGFSIESAREGAGSGGGSGGSGGSEGAAQTRAGVVTFTVIVEAFAPEEGAGGGEDAGHPMTSANGGER